MGVRRMPNLVRESDGKEFNSVDEVKKEAKEKNPDATEEELKEKVVKENFRTTS